MLTVSKAGKEDIKEMCLLLQELFTLEKDFTADLNKQRRGLEFILENPQYGFLLLLKKGEEILGMANLLVTVSTATGGKVILLEDFIIKKECKKKGSRQVPLEKNKETGPKRRLHQNYFTG